MLCRIAALSVVVLCVGSTPTRANMVTLSGSSANGSSGDSNSYTFVTDATPPDTDITRFAGKFDFTTEATFDFSDPSHAMLELPVPDHALFEFGWPGPNGGPVLFRFIGEEGSTTQQTRLHYVATLYQPPNAPTFDVFFDASFQDDQGTFAPYGFDQVFVSNPAFPPGSVGLEFAPYA